MISRRTFLASSIMAIGALAMPKLAMGSSLGVSDAGSNVEWNRSQ